MQYAIIKNNTVENVIIAEPDFIESILAQYQHIEALDTLHEQGLGVGIGWTYEHNEFKAPVIIEPVIEPKTTLTKLEYMNRFTDTELTGIYTAAKSVVEIEIWLEKFKVTTEVDLTDPRTVSGVQALEDAGLIAAGRAQEILAIAVSGGL